MKQITVNAVLCCSLLFLQSSSTWAKPGADYGDYGVSDIGGAYQTLPDASPFLTSDLKPASTYDIGYGSPIVEQFVPSSGLLPVHGFGGGWGWKQPIPRPIIAHIPIYAKPVPIPIATFPAGWGWQGGGIF